MRTLWVLTAILACAAVLGTAASAASTASEPVVHVYDIRVTGTFRHTFSIHAGRLVSSYAETTSWSETYRGVRIEVLTSVYGDPMIEVRNASWQKAKGTIAGSIKVTTVNAFGKRHGCSSSSPEPGALALTGQWTPYGASYLFHIATGRSPNNPKASPPNCIFEPGGAAHFTRTRPDGGTESGRIANRSATLDLRLPTSKPGQPGLPLDRLQAGTGFAIGFRAKSRTRSQFEPSATEGTARITFVPRPPSP